MLTANIVSRKPRSLRRFEYGEAVVEIESSSLVHDFLNRRHLDHQNHPPVPYCFACGWMKREISRVEGSTSGL